MAKEVDVLLVTANEHETQAVFDVFEEATSKKRKPFHAGARVYADLGTVKKTRIVHVLSEMATAGPGATQQTVDLAIRALRPRAVICVGIAFGVNGKKQSIGDILISRQISLYDLQRQGSKIIQRGDKPHASTKLINFFTTAQSFWTGEASITPGIILSGDKLVDNIDYRQQLLNFEVEAIGGEMEAAGVYTSSQEHKVDWIVVKSICDWGDGHKSKNKKKRQQKAGRIAAEFLLHALQMVQLSAMLDQYPRRTQAKVRAKRRGTAKKRGRKTPPSDRSGLFALKPFEGWAMNSVHIEREKHTRGGAFWVNATFHLIVGESPIKLTGIDRSYYAPFGCECADTTERTLFINGQEPMQFLPDGATLKSPISLEASSDHQLACRWRMRPPSIELTPFNCDAGDLKMQVTVRKGSELEYRTFTTFYRFEENGARLQPVDQLRVPTGLRDEDIDRAVADMQVPQRIYEQLKQLSPCVRYLVAETNGNTLLENLLLNSEHRKWLRDIRAHSTPS